MDATATRETLGFQAEVTQLLHLMVHSLYGNKEIVLRELVSNASDAADKLRFEGISDAALFEDDPDMRILVSVDPVARTLTISDNGVGMSRQEVIDQIGTIAKSGTREFLQQLSAERAKDANLIGQFGVGFYSAFIVADQVTLVTRRAGLGAGHGVIWRSTGEGDYTVETIHKASRGTDVTLHLRPGEDELLSGDRIRLILRKYSDHISVPVLMKKEKWDTEQKRYVLNDDIEQVNRASALWTRSKSAITDAEYEEFYKYLAHDFDSPLAQVHAKVEGRQEYTQLFFIPKRPSFELPGGEQRHGIKLYVRRVFVLDDAQELMPRYLRFVRGIIDSSDLPLNVSRELLQQSRDVQNIRVASSKRVLTLLEDLAAEESSKYATFWSSFGRVLKEGVVEDAANRQRIARLLRFASTHDGTGGQTSSLADYVGRMREGQEEIFYIASDNLAAARNGPQLEVFAKRGVEVLLMCDPIDEWVVSSLQEFEGRRLQSVAKGDLDLSKLGFGAEIKEATDPIDDEQSLMQRIRDVLQGRVSGVRATERLTESPACLVTEDGGISMNLERILKAAGQTVGGTKPVLEINVQHPIVKHLSAEDEPRFTEWCEILFDEALLAQGGHVDNPAGFVKRLNTLILTLAGEGNRASTP